MPPAQINQPEPEVKERKPVKKEKSFLNKLFILILLIVIVGGLIFIVISARFPDLLDDEEPDEPDVVEPRSGLGWLLLFIIAGGIILGVGYVILKGLGGNKEPAIPKIPVLPDRAEELFIENFSLKYGVECVYDAEKKLYRPADKNAISLIGKHPFFHTATGDNFLLMEVEVTEGKRQGIHIVILPIDKGEEIIKGGWYRIDSNTPKHQFMLNRVNYPMSSTADKSDRMRLAMMERMGDDKNAQDLLGKPSNQNLISTPLDSYGEGTDMGYSLPTPYRRRPSYRRPSYRRRYY